MELEQATGSARDWRSNRLASLTGVTATETAKMQLFFNEVASLKGLTAKMQLFQLILTDLSPSAMI
ncbi:hypothetical protein [Paenibacillus protaetiae]|uniref:Uncharacterized protein n=1 Tax=Paenibacillus protaetiae TaxID=2509456 RepID=A0A4P6F9F0_9BACL|nr:hypothetical protein [Paenibacillus protaetiae]QAY67108.1 hypothetical protein ET464_12580 [Paenibacillus protaetiae]